MRKFLLIALCFFPLTARAQTIQVGAWPNGTLDLSGDSTQWHTHSGDDPAWGQSAFDDTAWPAVSLASQPGSRAGWAWFRIRLHLSDPHAPLALLVTGGDGTLGSVCQWPENSRAFAVASTADDLSEEPRRPIERQR
jgi:hypothetical protein